MKVIELIELLKKYENDTEVLVQCPCGCDNPIKLEPLYNEFDVSTYVNNPTHNSDLFAETFYEAVDGDVDTFKGVILR